MTLMNTALNDLTVLILGLGDSGLAMARWCARRGAQVRVWDSRDQPPQADALREAVPAATLLRGALEAAACEGVDRVLKSPGLAPADPRLAALLQWAEAQGVPVQGELDLFAEALAELKRDHGYAPHVVAITGTNGKTTTTAMTHLLVGRAGRRAVMAGNIGPTMLQTLSDALDLEALPQASEDAEEEGSLGAGPHPNLPPEGEGAESQVAEVDLAREEADGLPHPVGEGGGEGPQAASVAIFSNETTDEAKTTLSEDDEALPVELIAPPPAAPVFAHLPEVWVLELSSFQLHGVQGFEPSAAVVLNVTEDHLDWHGSLPAYAADKARIFGLEAVMVVNRDDPLVVAMAEPAPPPAPVAAPGTRGRAKQPKPPKVKPRRVVRFGLQAPQHPGDFGLVTEQGIAWLVRAREADETFKPKRGAARVDEEIHLQRLMPADALRVRGRHNAANALAALALATAIGCPLAPMLHGLREYTGEPHRVAYVATLNNVDVYDDSKGTNVGATVAAILGLGADRAPARMVVILGGDGKGQRFEPLAAPVQAHARAVATLGRDAERIEAALSRLALPLQRFDTLPQATRWAVQQAQPGDAVLLSPACASLDMFDNYAHRARVFVDEVRAMAGEQGEVLA
jgi:UDP-N-acetylmuramoylalanine--D-glutamate ligase